MLTDRFIRNAKAGKYADEGGLYLKVYASGKKSFVLRTRIAGKDAAYTLGHYPTMGLAAAREAANKRRSGHTSITVAAAFATYYKHLQTQYVRPELVERMFLLDIAPRLGESHIDLLARADWAGVIQKVLDRGSPVAANRLLAEIKKFLAFCEQRGIADSPMAGVTRAAFGGKETPKDRVLSFDEIQAFYQTLRDSDMDAGTRWTLWLIMLTGLRATEAINLPPSGEVITKLQRIHRVPLTPHVRALFRVRPPKLPQDHRVLSHALRRLKQTFTPHDLRRTFATRMSDLGVMPHVIEKMLDHKMEGVMAVYNRAEYWPERIAAMKLWGRELRKLRQKKTPD
jgi:integrase